MYSRLPDWNNDSKGQDIFEFLLDFYGVIELESLKTYVETFISEENRVSQYNIILFNCMIKRLSTVGMVKIYNKIQDILIKSTQVVPFFQKLLKKKVASRLMPKLWLIMKS